MEIEVGSIVKVRFDALEKQRRQAYSPSDRDAAIMASDLFEVIAAPKIIPSITSKSFGRHYSISCLRLPSMKFTVYEGDIKVATPVEIVAWKQWSLENKSPYITQQKQENTVNYTCQKLLI